MPIIIYQFLIVFLVAWFSSTATIDFLVLPKLFRSMPEAFEAGKIGMVLFECFNKCELVLAVIIFFLSVIFFLKKRKSLMTKVFFILSVMLLSIAGTYTFYLTPKISSLTNILLQQDLLEAQRNIWMEQHSVFHNLYVKVDGGKLVILLLMIIMLLIKSSKSFESKEQNGLL